jgi:hypothetical protein
MPGHIEDYLEDSGMEVDGDADILGAGFIDEDGDDVTEVGARVRRRGSRSPFSFRRLRIPSSLIRKATGAPIRSAQRNSYASPSEGGAMTPLAVGQATPAAATITVEPQVEFQPLRMLVSAYDTATLADVAFRIRITDIKVGARTMLRAGGAANGVQATLFTADYTGANPARYDAIRPGTQFSVTFAGLVATDVADVSLVGRAG